MVIKSLKISKIIIYFYKQNLDIFGQIEIKILEHAYKN